jgi:serine/threonine protein kinase
MMAVNTVEEFLLVLEKSKLLRGEQFAEVRRLAKASADAAVLAKSLAHQEIISRWQAAQLLAGRSAFFLGKYKLIELLGRGGMGSVFLAEHTTMNRRVALKVVPRHVSSDRASLDRFFAEARAIAALDHPNIVQAYSVDCECDRHFIVMEYVDGLDLERMVEAEGPLDFARAADYIHQAADGLAHAHARSMVHCDIKPSNLLVNQQGVVKILDMGLARLKGDDAEPAGRPEEHALGTVDYLAPEQALGTSEFDHRADIYSLGCTLYYLLTGHPPFPEGTLPQRIVKHQTQEPRSILEERPDAPRELVAVCRKMMAKRPDERFQSAEEVSQTLALWQPPARPAQSPLPLKTARPLEVELPGTELGANAWWNDIVSTPATASGAMWAVQAGPEGRPSGKARSAGQRRASSAMTSVTPAGSAIGRKRPGMRRRRIVAAVAAGTLAVAAIAGLLFLALHGSTKPTLAHSVAVEKSDPGIEIARPNLLPEAELKAAHQQLQAKTPEPVKKAEKAAGKTEQPKPPQSPEKPKTEKPAAKPPIEKQPAGSPKPPPSKPDQANPKPDEPKAKPPQAKPEGPQRPETPLGELAKTKAVDLPAIGEPGVAAQPVTLGNVYLQGDASLELQLLNSRTTGRARPKFTLRSEEAGKHRWLVQAETGGPSSGKPADVARLWLDKQALDFQWLAGAAEVRAEHLRNCGLVLNVGEESRFLPLRTAKEVEPVVLDLDRRGPEKEQNERTLADDALPEAQALRMQLLGLEQPFPAHTVRIIGARKSETALSAKGNLFIVFNDTQLSPFALRVSFDVKQGAPVVLVSPMFNLNMYKPVVDQLPLSGKAARAKRHSDKGYTPFLPGDAANIKASLVTWEREFKEAIPKLKDNQKKLKEAQLTQIQERLRQINALYEALQKTAVIQFRVFVPIDEGHDIDLFRTRPPEHKVADARGGKP